MGVGLIPSHPHLSKIMYKFLTLSLCVFGLLAELPAQNGQTANVSWTTDGAVNFEGLGRRLYIPDDLNGDGIRDLLSVNPHASTNLLSDNGAIQAISGSSGDLLWRLDGAYDGQQLGINFPRVEDLDGDGVRDMVTITSTASMNGFIRNGYAQAISGTTGTLMWQKFGMSDGEELGTSYANVADINGDGSPELVVGSATASSMGLNRNGYVEMISGRWGFTVWRVNGTADSEGIGAYVARVEDLNGDGIADVLAANSEFSSNSLYHNGMVMAISGQTGQILWQTTGAHDNALLGQNAESLPDVNGDGVDDILVLNPDGFGTWLSENGSTVVLSGADGSQLWKFEGLFNGERFGMTWMQVEDMDMDGVGDIVLGSPEADAMGLPSSGHVTALSGANGMMIWQRSGMYMYGRYGETIFDAGDINGDGFGDIVMASPAASTGSFWNPLTDNGLVEAISGMGGYPLWVATGSISGAHLGNAMIVAEDVNGDGFKDFLSGSGLADSGNFANNGEIMAISGMGGYPLWSTQGDSNDAHLGTNIRMINDLDGDGVEEVLSWVTYADTGDLINNGSVRAHNGATGAELWRHDGSTNDMRMGDAVTMGDDFDFDGFDDIYVASSEADSNGLADNGRVVGISSGLGTAFTVSGLTAGADANLMATGLTPGATAYFLASTAGAGTTYHPRGFPIALKEPIMTIGVATVDSNGNTSTSVSVPTGTKDIQVWMQVLTVNGREIGRSHLVNHVIE